MPHVASESKSLALKSALAHAARPPQDRAPAAMPFESLLDNPSAAPRPDDGPRAEAAAKSEPAKSDNAKQVKSSHRAVAKAHANSDTKADASPADDAGGTGEAKPNEPKSDAVGNGKAAADAKTVEQAAAGTDLTPAQTDDTNTAEVIVATVASSAVAVEPLAQVALADAPEATPTAAPDAPAQVVALVAAGVKPGSLVPAQDSVTDSAKDGVKDSAAKDGTEKAKAEPNFQPESATQPHTDAKAQTPANTSGKDAIAQFRGEAPLASHRNSEAPASDTTSVAPKIDAVPPQILPAPQHTQAASATAAAPAAQLPQTQAVPLAGVAIEIVNKAIAGTNHFQIRLDPPELGRIEVRLHVDRDGNVTSRMIADRADTLDLLRRDASGLERALQDAGLKTTNSGLQFSLRDHSTGREQTQSGPAAQLVIEDETLVTNEPVLDYGRLAGRGSGLDIRV